MDPNNQHLMEHHQQQQFYHQQPVEQHAAAPMQGDLQHHQYAAQQQQQQQQQYAPVHDAAGAVHQPIPPQQQPAQQTASHIPRAGSPGVGHHPQRTNGGGQGDASPNSGGAASPPHHQSQQQQPQQQQAGHGGAPTSTGGHVSSKDLKTITTFCDFFQGLIIPPRKYFPHYQFQNNNRGGAGGAGSPNNSSQQMDLISVGTSSTTGNYAVVGGHLGAGGSSTTGGNHSIGASCTMTSIGNMSGHSTHIGGNVSVSSGAESSSGSSWMTTDVGSNSTSTVSPRGSLIVDPPPLPPNCKFEALRVLGAGVSGTVLLVRRVTDNVLYSFKCTKYLSGHVNAISSRHKRRRDRAFSEADCIGECNFFSIIRSYGSYLGGVPGTVGVGSSVSVTDLTTGEALSSKTAQRLREQIEKAAMGSCFIPHVDNTMMQSTPSPERPAQPSNDAVPTEAGGAPPPGEGGAQGEENPDKISDNAKEDRVLGICMELADSGDLRQELKHRRSTNYYFRPIQAGLLFTQLLLAVYHMHKLNIYHRDLKPANVLMDHSGLLKVGDFGFAKKVEPGDMEADFLGTAYYIAPEIWKRRPYEKAVDIYALGVILYEILMLKRPFTGNSLQAIQRAALAGQYQEPNIYLSLTAAKHPLCNEEVETFANLTSMMSHMIRTEPTERPTAEQLVRSPAVVQLALQLINATNNNPLITELTRRKILIDIGSCIPGLVVEDPRGSMSISGASTSLFSLEGLNAGMNSGYAYAGNNNQPVDGDPQHAGKKRVAIVHQEGAVLKESGSGRWKIRYVVIRTIVHTSINTSSPSTSQTPSVMGSQNSVSAGGNNHVSVSLPKDIQQAETEDEREAHRAQTGADAVITSVPTGGAIGGASSQNGRGASSSASTTSNPVADEAILELVMGVVREDIDIPGKSVRSTLKDFSRCVRGDPQDFDNRDNVFCILSDKWRTLTFQASTSDEREQWVKTVNVLCGATDV